jgi:hypothetical protein
MHGRMDQKNSSHAMILHETTTTTTMRPTRRIGRWS